MTAAEIALQIADEDIRSSAETVARKLEDIARDALRAAEQFRQVAEGGMNTPVAVATVNSANLVSGLERDMEHWHRAVGAARVARIISDKS